MANNFTPSKRRCSLNRSGRPPCHWWWNKCFATPSTVDYSSFTPAQSTIDRVRTYIHRVSKTRWHLDLKKITQWKMNRYLVFFGTQNPKETTHHMIINVSTSPVKCSHCTLWKADNVHLIEATIMYQNALTILLLTCPLDTTNFSL